MKDENKEKKTKREQQRGVNIKKKEEYRKKTKQKEVNINQTNNSHWVCGDRVLIDNWQIDL